MNSRTEHSQDSSTVSKGAISQTSRIPRQITPYRRDIFICFTIHDERAKRKITVVVLQLLPKFRELGDLVLRPFLRKSLLHLAPYSLEQWFKRFDSVKFHNREILRKRGLPAACRANEITGKMPWRLISDTKPPPPPGEYL